MNEEEFKKYIREMAKKEINDSFNNNLMETLNSAFIFKYVDTLEQQNKKYKEVIDKAIKYANNHINQETFDGYMDSYELKKLLDILKEESK